MTDQDIICECGHAASKHGRNGCNCLLSQKVNVFCSCQLSPAAITLTVELQKAKTRIIELEKIGTVAMAALDRSGIAKERDWIERNDLVTEFESGEDWALIFWELISKFGLGKHL